MNDLVEKEARKLAEEHWAWLESILEEQRRMEKKLFIDAFIHGFKHGEDYDGEPRIDGR